MAGWFNQRFSQSALVVAAVLLSGLIGATTLFVVNRVEATETNHSIKMIADARLSDQNGKPVKIVDLENKLVMMNFFFTGCEGACPVQTAVLRDVRDELSQNLDMVFLSVSIAPYTDTEDAINNYIDKYNLGQSDWKFSKTSVKRLKKLIDHFGVTVENAVVSENNDQIDHRNMGYLFGKNGNLMQQYQLLPGITERLAREITQLSQLQL